MEIVRLQDGDTRVSAYCLPTSTGSIYEYFELAKAIGPGHLIYGIQFADRLQTGGFQEFSSLREMAGAMLPGFLAHHRDGPICLIGYSFAACLAIELAQQLLGLGKMVPLVVIIDRKPSANSFAPSFTPSFAPSFAPLFRIKHFMRNFGPWAIRVTTRAVTDAHYRSRYLDKIFHKLGRKRRPEWYANLPKDIRDYTEKNIAASHNYRFEGSYPNKILLFRTCEDAHPLRYISAEEEDYGWGTITGANVEVVRLPRDHLSMMRNPDVVHIANALQLALRNCESSRYQVSPLMKRL